MTELLLHDEYPMESAVSRTWPELDYLAWRETCSALHLYLQIVGKYALAHTPFLNHSWNATFRATPNGLATPLIHDGPGIEILFDLHAHKVVATSGSGRSTSFPIGPSTVARFHSEFASLVSELGGTPVFDGLPNQLPYPVPFAEDHRDRPYDGDAVRRFHQSLVAVDRVFKTFHASFLGKSSPVHLFWGRFDLAVARYSGRRAPLHRGGVPDLPDKVVQEAHDREVSLAGFWPGGGGIDYPAFYARAWPLPGGYRATPIQPDAAFWHDGLSEFILPYDAVQSAADPDEVLMAFLASTYAAAANLGQWDRGLLERAHDAQRQQHQVRAPDPLLANDLPSSGDDIVEREDTGTKGRYRLVVDGIEAEMTYSRAGDGLIIIDHTDVPAALRGRRIGERLVRQAIEDARREHVAIIPLCPFAKAQIMRHPEWQDVLHQSPGLAWSRPPFSFKVSRDDVNHLDPPNEEHA